VGAPLPARLWTRARKVRARRQHRRSALARGFAAPQLRESDSSGAVDYTWANGLLSQQDTTGYSAVLADGLGSVRALANTQGQIVGSFAYDTFGNAQGTAGGTVTTNFHFAGEQTDPATGLINLRARSYDPRAGRFVSRDSLIQAGSGTQAFHRYAYVGNNPSRLTDPTGHGSCEPQVISTPSFFGHSVEVPLRPLTVCTDPEPLQVSPDHLKLPDYTDGGSLNVTLPGDGCRPTPPLDLGNTIVDPIYEGSPGIFVSSATGAATDSGSTVTNPGGSRGGTEHQKTIRDRIDQLKGEGYDHLNRGSEVEEWIRIPDGGDKSARRPDITMQAPDGAMYRENVGRSRLDGIPIARERRELEDIEGATGQRPAHTPYDR